MNIRTFVAALAMLGLTTSAQADGAWRAQLSSYLWAPNVSGHVKPLGSGAVTPSFNVDKSFGDLLKDLDGALFLHGTLRRDRFVLFGDLTWTKLSAEHHAVVLGYGVPAGATISQMSATALAGYAIFQQPNVNFDLLGGARIWHIKASAHATLPVFGYVDQSTTQTWTDPVIGARLRVNLNNDWSVILYGDGGGFGVGSKSTWQVVGTLNYRVNDSLFLSAGYRHMVFDYRQDGKVLDIKMSGPLFGATWRF